MPLSPIASVRKPDSWTRFPTTPAAAEAVKPIDISFCWIYLDRSPVAFSSAAALMNSSRAPLKSPCIALPKARIRCPILLVSVSTLSTTLPTAVRKKSQNFFTTGYFLPKILSTIVARPSAISATPLAILATVFLSFSWRSSVKTFSNSSVSFSRINAMPSLSFSIRRRSGLFSSVSHFQSGFKVLLLSRPSR